MRTADLQKALDVVHDTLAASLDHLADRFQEGADKLGDEYAHLAEFAAGWIKLAKAQRKVFVEQLLKSSGLVLVTGLATKAGIKLASKRQMASSLITPTKPSTSRLFPRSRVTTQERALGIARLRRGARTSDRLPSALQRTIDGGNRRLEDLSRV